MATLAVLDAYEAQARVTAADARKALDTVHGMGAVAAVTRLRFGPGRTCEQVARILDKALARAEDAGLRPDQLVVVGGSAEPAEDIVRVRRKAHGKADWINSPTADVRVELRPAGLVEAESAPAPVRVAEAPVEVVASPPDDRSGPVWDALYDVLDPDLGVNVVDLGFVRGVTVGEDGVVLTMTLTSPACPLTGVMEDQIGTALADVVPGFRVDWVWSPAWKPADISADGRDQLRAIGFNTL